MKYETRTLDGRVEHYESGRMPAAKRGLSCWQIYAPMGGACAYFARTGSPWLYIPAIGFGAASVYDFAKQNGIAGLATALYDSMPQPVRNATAHATRAIKAAIPKVFLKKSKKEAA